MKSNIILKISILILILFSIFCNAQKIKQCLTTNDFSENEISFLKSEFGNKKSFDSIYKHQILTTLSFFPELKKTNIIFRLKETNTPLSSRPTFWSLFKSHKNRTYLITISTKTNKKLEPILFKNLSYNQQIGVLGHELSHVSDYSNTGFLKMCSFLGIQIFSKIEVDKFEARTDKICIDHGLGFQLLDWSRAVRQKLYIKNWRGANNFERVSVKERYLNPETIQELINQNKLYFELK